MEKVIVLDFGGQYGQLIARRIRKLGVYCELKPNYAKIDDLFDADVKGIILAGGPSSIRQPDAPVCDDRVFSIGVPMLGICYGAQLMATRLGGEVGDGCASKHSDVTVEVIDSHPLFDGIGCRCETLRMGHSDSIVKLPENFKCLAKTESCQNAAIGDGKRKFFAIQFHPEAFEGSEGDKLLSNFVRGICGCAGTWTMESLQQEQIRLIRETVGSSRVISALSGGVDSAVASVLVHKAVGDQLTCIFVDHGLLREGEVEEVLGVYKNKFGMNLVFVDARERFLSKLKGVTDPERKRKIIGEEFIRVFEEEALKLGAPDFLVQGTIYPDIIESGGSKDAVAVKSHHNVGGLPENIRFKQIIEPLKSLFKDEVRELGEKLGIPAEQVWRQPFPGPGLAVRVLGEVTEEKLRIVRKSDWILREEIKKAGLARDIWQYFTVFLPVRAVGVKHGTRTYEHAIAIRAVLSTDAMTVDFARIDYDLLNRISNRIIAEVEGVNRVVYDITSKPPGTIEWE